MSLLGVVEKVVVVIGAGVKLSEAPHPALLGSGERKGRP